MAVTINDVARKAGVSHTTVSWVIHDDPRITDATKSKVMTAITDLDYHPNLAARSLVRGKTNTIALVAAEFSTNFENTFLRGVEDSFEKEAPQYEINLYSLMGKVEKKEAVLKKILHGNRADVLILLNLNISSEMIKKFNDKKIPLILVEEEAPNVHVLKMDNIQGVKLAMQYLIKKGRKNIALVAGNPEDPNSNMSPKERIQSYKKTLADADISLNENYIHIVDNYFFENGKVVYEDLITRNPEIDAIFCAAGDLLALGIMKTALEEGRSIPGELSIIGYDNIPVASMVSPPLTTIDQPIASLGQRTIELAVETMKGEVPKKYEVRTPSLIIRGSA